MKELINIQLELKAPKSNYNSFGKYRYRSAEDILTAVKPLLQKYNCDMTLTDELVNIGDRYYVKATATLHDSNGGKASTTAYAREDETKKGMDGSQITGTASSYARKYALNGLFLIDDIKDADTDEYHNQTTEEKKASETTKKVIVDMCKKNNVNLDIWLSQAGATMESLTETQAGHMLNALRKKYGE